MRSGVTSRHTLAQLEIAVSTRVQRILMTVMEQTVMAAVRLIVLSSLHGVLIASNVLLFDAETDLLTTVASCGSCANNCASADWTSVATYSCAQGACGIATCVQNKADCDSDNSNGCGAFLDRLKWR